MGGALYLSATGMESNALQAVLAVDEPTAAGWLLGIYLHANQAAIKTMSPIAAI